MKKVLFLIAMLSIIPFWGHAQRVYKTTGNPSMIILDCSAASRMPQDAVTKTSKDRNDKTPDANKQVYYKLEVDSTDWHTEANWDTAYKRCVSKMNKWRLPTQRELQLLYLFRTAFTSFGTSFAMHYYWSSSEYDSDFSWCVDLSSGVTFSNGKINGCHVRCVREVTP